MKSVTVLAKNVKYYRQLRELTQKDLAALSGLARLIIVKVEQGTQNVTLETVDKISTALKVPTWRLLKELNDLEVASHIDIEQSQMALKQMEVDFIQLNSRISTNLEKVKEVFKYLKPADPHEGLERPLPRPKDGKP